MNPISHIFNQDRSSSQLEEQRSNIMKARKIIGFSGVIDHLLDFDLIHQLVSSLPMFDFHFVGPITAYKGALQLDEFPNVQFYGNQTANDMKELVKEFDITILPFVKESIINRSRLTGIAPNIPTISSYPFSTKASSLFYYANSVNEFIDQIIDKTGIYLQPEMEESLQKMA